MNRYKRILLIVLLSVPALQPGIVVAVEPEQTQDEVRLKKKQFAAQDSLREQEMRVRLAELEHKLQSEKMMHDQQSKLALEYAERVREIQQASQELKSIKEENLVKMQEKLKRELEMANLYNKERLLRIIDEKYHEDNAKIAELEDKCYELAALHKESKEAEKQRRLETELKAAITDLFDLREAEREREMKQLETDLTQMKEKLVQRRANKSQIVQKRLDQLLGKKDDMTW
jgi:hypothetical protein